MEYYRICLSNTSLFSINIIKHNQLDFHMKRNVKCLFSMAQFCYLSMHLYIQNRLDCQSFTLRLLGKDMSLDLL